MMELVVFVLKLIYWSEVSCTDYLAVCALVASLNLPTLEKCMVARYDPT